MEGNYALGESLYRKRLAVSGFYFVTGIVFASWASRIPDIRHALQLSDGELGSVLFAIPAGQLVMMALSGVLVNKYGSKITLTIATSCYSIVLFSIAFVANYWSLFACLFCFGAMANLQNIATNTQACFLEKLYGRNIMSSFHGLWSLGGFMGGIIGAAFVRSGSPIYYHFAFICAISILIIISSMHHLVDRDPNIAEGDEKPKFSFSSVDGLIILLGFMGFAGMFCEGTVYDWSAVYYTSVIRPDESMVRAGYIAGMGAMTLGRFLADWFITRFGAKLVLRTCGSLITIGLLIAVCLPHLLPATFGFLLVGFGISSTVPICYSIAGRQQKMPASIAITIVSSISFIGFLIGPPLIGLLSELTNLRIAIGIASMFGLLIVVLSTRLRGAKL